MYYVPLVSGEDKMSSFVYGFITAKRAAAPPGESQTTKAPAMTTYIDTVSALIPAEALALYAAIVAPNATKTASINGKTTTVISDSQLLGWSCAGLLLLSTALYLIGRYTNARYLSPWDGLRALIPPAAFTAWMLVQNPGVFDVWWPDSNTEERVVIAAFAAVALGILAKILGYQADQQSPPVPALAGQVLAGQEAAKGTGLKSPSPGSVALAARGAGPSNIVNNEKYRDGTDAEETAAIAPMQTGSSLADNRWLQWGTGIGLVVLLGGGIYLLVRQSSYPGDRSASEWFAGDTVLLGLIAVVAAFLTAVFAYPTFIDWRNQISGPKPTVDVKYLTADGTTFDVLPLEAELRQVNGPNKIYPTLQFAVNNPSKVALRDGRLSVYVQPADGGNDVPYVTPKPQTGKVSKFEIISHASWPREPKLPASLLFAECPCPPRNISYIEERLKFPQTEVYLRIVLDGTNLRAPLTGRYKVRVTSKLPIGKLRQTKKAKSLATPHC
jgi:hypothetical protein